jgi:hypothetical protein
MADQFAKSDVESLGKKLEEFSKTLTPGEHAALMEILKRAQPEGGDVQGYSFNVSSASMSSDRLSTTSSVSAVVQSLFTAL